MDLLENTTFRVHMITYIRNKLGIHYVNMDRLKVDTTRNISDGMAYIFGDTFQFIVKQLPNNTYVFSQ